MMAYYFISSDPKRFSSFPKRFTFLGEGILISDFKELQLELPKLPQNACFFVHMVGPRSKLDEYVLAIRQADPSKKIIYVTEENAAQDLKAHQLTPVGGDAYVGFKVESDDLTHVMDCLGVGETDQPSQVHVQKQESEFESLKKMKEHPLSQALDQIFQNLAQTEQKPRFQSTAAFKLPSNVNDAGDSMSDKDQEVSLDELEELELQHEVIHEPEATLETTPEVSAEDEIELEDLDLAAEDETEDGQNDINDESSALSLSLDGEEGDAEGEKSLDLSEGVDELKLEESDGSSLGLTNDQSDSDMSLDSLTDDENSLDELGLDFGQASSPGTNDLSPAAKEKLKEIDAIMDLDASQVSINMRLNSEAPEGPQDSNLNESLVAEDLNLDNINFSIEESSPKVASTSSLDSTERDDKPKRKKRESEQREEMTSFSGDLERTQATISNLRADREELLLKIQRLEEDKMLQSRQNLTMRAELDEKKIELSIIRKKLNNEISELKDQLKLFDEKRLILEERNRLLLQELDKAGQKNKIDMKKVQMRERELEQRLELLKADSETQIRNRDLKILELKRKIDAMEFDMESISVQEKRSVESRYELEDKLDKAIKTLRSAITVLENESDKGSALDALKKNIDM